MARDGTADQQHIIFFVNAHDFEMPDRHPLIAIMARHLLPLEHAARILPLAGGGCVAVAQTKVAPALIGIAVLWSAEMSAVEQPAAPSSSRLKVAD